MVTDEEVATTLREINNTHMDEIAKAIIIHIVNTVKDDLCVTYIAYENTFKSISIIAECDGREEHFEITYRKDDNGQIILGLSRGGFRIGKQFAAVVSSRRFTISDPSFTPDTIIRQIRRYYRT